MPAAKFFVDQPWYPSIPCQCTTTAPFSMVTLVSWCTWLPPKLWATISNTWGEWGGEAGCGNKNAWRKPTKRVFKKNNQPAANTSSKAHQIHSKWLTPKLILATMRYPLILWACIMQPVEKNSYLFIFTLLNSKVSICLHITPIPHLHHPFLSASLVFFSDNPGWIRIPGGFTVWPVLGVNVASRATPWRKSRSQTGPGTGLSRRPANDPLVN